MLLDKPLIQIDVATNNNQLYLEAAFYHHVQLQKVQVGAARQLQHRHVFQRVQELAQEDKIMPPKYCGRKRKNDKQKETKCPIFRCECYCVIYI